MSLTRFDVQSPVPSLKLHYARIIGADGANPTKTYGDGMTITRTAEGKYRITFSEFVGTPVAMFFCHRHATPAATTPRLVETDHDSWSASARTIDFYVVTPATDTVAAALGDLVATDALDILILCAEQVGLVK